MTLLGTASKTKSPGDSFFDQIPESHGDRGIIPISLKRERESAKPEFARAMRFLEVSANASGGSRPTSVTTPTPAPKTQAASPEATEINGDFFAAFGPTQTPPSTTSDGHMGHFGHFVALPNTGENNYPYKKENRDNKREYSTAGEEGMPRMADMPNGRVITRSDHP